MRVLCKCMRGANVGFIQFYKHSAFDSKLLGFGRFFNGANFLNYFRAAFLPFIMIFEVSLANNGVALNVPSV